MQKKSLVLIILAMFLVAGLGMAGCSKEKTASPGRESQPTATQKAGGEKGDASLEDLMKSAKNIKGMSYDMVTTMTSPEGTHTSSGKIWISGEKVRIESETAGMKSIMITDNKGDMYMVTDKTAMKIPAADDQTEPANAWADEELDKMKVVGKEKIDGHNCTVVEVTEEGNVTKMWLRQDIGMPVKIESKADNATIVIENKNFKIGAQPDSLFELPAGVQVMEMPDFSQMPGVPQP